MSLRVLLADESSTIKKVMQLALQDFGVEVKSVPNGLDVSDVAKTFRPDIIFTDILLAKKNGYDVCAEFKRDTALSELPFVLMWSSFMSLDEKKLSLAEPTARLEKPFDAQTLRDLTKRLVPKLQTNKISQYLTFPELPEIQEDAKSVAAPYPPAKSPSPLPPSFPHPTEDADDEPEQFMQVPLPNSSSQKGKSSLKEQIKEAKEDWSQQSLSQFKLPVTDEDLAMAYEMTSENPGSANIAYSDVGDHAISSPQGEPEDLTLQSRSHRLSPSISHERIEQIMREEIRKTLETIAWKVLPDLAERIVREEIQKLLKDAERL